MRLNYTNETLGEFILRITGKSLALSAMILLLGMAIHMQVYAKQLDEYESTWKNLSYEKKSVKEEVFNYIDTLPLPEETQEQPQTAQAVTETQIIDEKEAETNEIGTLTALEEITNVETTAYDVDYTQSDVELLARLMYAEEGVYIYKLPEAEAKYINQLAGSVVLHRRDTNFGGAQTVEDVIFADGQYDCVTRGTIYQEVPDIVYEWAEELLQNGPIGPDNLVYQAEFPQGSDIFDQKGNQYFCLQ